MPATISTQFAYYWFAHSYERLRDLGHGAHQKNLSAALVKTFPFPFPQHAEQERIGQILLGVDRELGAEESRKRALDALFTTLLRDLMTGRARVNQIPLPETVEVA